MSLEDLGAQAKTKREGGSNAICYICFMIESQTSKSGLKRGIVGVRGRRERQQGIEIGGMRGLGGMMSVIETAMTMEGAITVIVIATGHTHEALTTMKMTGTAVVIVTATTTGIGIEDMAATVRQKGIATVLTALPEILVLHLPRLLLLPARLLALQLLNLPPHRLQQAQLLISNL